MTVSVYYVYFFYRNSSSERSEKGSGSDHETELNSGPGSERTPSPPVTGHESSNGHNGAAIELKDGNGQISEHNNLVRCNGSKPVLNGESHGSDSDDPIFIEEVVKKPLVNGYSGKPSFNGTSDKTLVNGFNNTLTSNHIKDRALLNGIKDEDALYLKNGGTDLLHSNGNGSMNSIDNCSRTHVTKPLTNGESRNGTRDLASYSFSRKSVSVIDASVESSMCVSVADLKSTKAECNETLAKVECNTRLYHPSLPKDNVKNSASDLSIIKAEVKTESNSDTCDTNSSTFTPNLSPGTYVLPIRLRFYFDMFYITISNFYQAIYCMSEKSLLQRLDH